MSNYGLPQVGVNAESKYPFYQFGNDSLHSAMGFSCKLNQKSKIKKKI